MIEHEKKPEDATPSEVEKVKESARMKRNKRMLTVRQISGVCNPACGDRARATSCVGCFDLGGAAIGIGSTTGHVVCA